MERGGRNDPVPRLVAVRGPSLSNVEEPPGETGFSGARSRRSIPSRSLTRPDPLRPSQPSPISRNTYRHGPRNRRPGRFRARPGPDRAMSLSEGTEGRRRSPDRGRCRGDSSRQSAVLGRPRACHAAPAEALGGASRAVSARVSGPPGGPGFAPADGIGPHGGPYQDETSQPLRGPPRVDVRGSPTSRVE